MRRILFYDFPIKLSLGVVAFAMSMSSCTESNLYNPETKVPVTLENYFNFSTTQSVQVNINYGREFPKTYFEVYAENPLEEKDGQIVKKAGLMHIASGFTDKNGAFNAKASIPASVSDVFIYSPDFGVPTLYSTTVSGNAITAQISFENDIELSSLAKKARATNTRAAKDFTSVVPLTLGTWNNNGKPNYLVDSLKITVSPLLKSYITTYFQEGKDNGSSPYITDDADITIYKKANVTINYFGGQTGAQSVFAYYCYSATATKEEIQKAAKNACMIFPRAHKEALGDYSGVGVTLKYIKPDGQFSEDGAFPPNTKIGFLIWNDAWIVDRNRFYSTKSLNSDNRSHTAVFGAEDENGKKYNVITMEDWSDTDYNDIAFVITSDPINAIEVPPAPKPEDRVGTDSYRGLLSFEDNWPNKGDYDMNDVVVKYNSNVDYNYENNVISITDKFTLSWTGANYRNGFAYEVPFDLTQANVTASKGITVDKSKNIITLFTDARSELGVSNIAAVNMPSQNVKEVTYTVSITFNKPSINKSEIVPPYNPFIKINNGTTEVHLTDYPPTKDATNTFPNGQDISTGTNGRYFICKDGFPFAFHMDARIDKTLMDVNLKNELKRIDSTYPKFAEWAKTRNPKTKWW